MSEPGPVTTRVSDELSFDDAAGHLRVGSLDAHLPDGAGNREVLGTYVDLVGQRRGQRVASSVEVRGDDVDVLAGLLDLDAVGIDALITEILGSSPAETASLLDRLRARRRMLAVTAVAAGVVVTGGIALAAGNRSTPASDQPVRPPTVTSPVDAEVPATAPPSTARQPTATATTSPETTKAPPDQPVETTPDGVGLVDPAQEDGQGVGLIPPTSVDNPDPGSSTTATAPGSTPSGG